ncbi:group-specific protein [Rossellomorea marisflavi]|uniref:group-specific protein n=1 Tax=Rossellomorea marisflavi TaxID=189381 RepID=UPI003511ECBC
MIEVKVKQEEVKELYLEELKKAIKEAEKQTIFWDMKELVRQTRLSINTIQNEFFYEPDFPKYKIGRKWMFPAKKTREFLLEWIERQPRY